MEPSQIRFNGEYDYFKTGITQSRLNDWLHCKRLGMLKLLGYSGNQREETTAYGNCIHQILDWIYTKGVMPSKGIVSKLIDRYDKKYLKKTKLAMKDKQAMLANAEAVLWGYIKYYSDDFKQRKYYDPEHEFSVVINGVTFRGKIDARFRTNKSKWIKDHKTKGRIEEDKILLGLSMDIQSLTYLKADDLETGERAKGMEYNVIRNPVIKPRVNESLMQFRDRLYEDIESRPDFYFKRWEAVYTMSDIIDFDFDLEKWTNEIKDYVDNNKYCTPSRHCTQPFKCEFLENCANKNMDGVKRTKNPFPELEALRGDNKKEIEKTNIKVLIRKEKLKQLKRKIRLKSSK